MLHRDLAVLASLPGSTAEGLGDLSQLVLFSALVSFLPSLPTGVCNCTIFPKICSLCVSVWIVLHKLHLLRCYYFTTIT